MPYLVLDIETVPDLAVWEPPQKLPDRIKGPKEKPSKPDQAFWKILAERLETGADIHPSDLEKGAELADLMEPEAAEPKNGEATAGPKSLSVRQMIAARTPEEDRPFPPVYAHRPVAIGYLAFDDNFTVTAFGCTTCDAAADERAMLEGWGAVLDQQRPVIVGWSSRGFDLPVLNMRSLRRGVVQRWYDGQYRKRYEDGAHVDLKDVLSEFGAAGPGGRGFSLDEVAKTIGLPGKWGGMDGSKVAAMHAAGQMDRIRVYNLTDVIQTAFVFLRWKLVRGHLTLDHYRAAAGALLAGVRGAPELVEFCSLIDEITLLLQEG